MLYIFIFITVFSLLESKIIDNLHLSLVNACTPNSYVIIGCNVCLCDDRGKVNKDFCTRRTCPSHYLDIAYKTRRSYSVDGSCEPGNWYSAESCQICYCVVKNKLYCNSVTSQDKLQLGKFDFTICGSNFLQEASQLVSNVKDLRNTKKKKKAKKNFKNKVKKTTTTPAPESANTDELFQELFESKRYSSNSNLNNEEFNDDKDDLSPEFARKIGQTVFPLEDDYNEPLTKRKDSGEASDNTHRNKGEIGRKEDNLLNRPSYLEIDLPSILNDVLNMRRRKSMLSLNKKDNCTPGETFSSACEKCFCLKNGKMLCTQKHCKNKR